MDKDLAALADSMEQWRWRVAECYGREGITDPEKRKALDDLDKGVEMLRQKANGKP